MIAATRTTVDAAIGAGLVLAGWAVVMLALRWLIRRRERTRPFGVVASPLSTTPPPPPRRVGPSAPPRRPHPRLWTRPSGTSSSALAEFLDDGPPAPVVPLAVDPPARSLRRPRQAAVQARDGSWTPVRAGRHATTVRLVSALPAGSAGVGGLAEIFARLATAPGVRQATCVAAPSAEFLRWTLEIAGRPSRAMVHLDHLHAALAPAMLLPDDTPPPPPPTAKERRAARRLPPSEVVAALATSPADLLHLAGAVAVCAQVGCGVVVGGHLLGDHPGWDAWAVAEIDLPVEQDEAAAATEAELVRQLLRLAAAGVTAAGPVPRPDPVLEAWRSARAA